MSQITCYSIKAVTSQNCINRLINVRDMHVANRAHCSNNSPSYGLLHIKAACFVYLCRLLVEGKRLVCPALSDSGIMNTCNQASSRSVIMNHNTLCQLTASFFFWLISRDVVICTLNVNNPLPSFSDDDDAVINGSFTPVFILLSRCGADRQIIGND